MPFKGTCLSYCCFLNKAGTTSQTFLRATFRKASFSGWPQSCLEEPGGLKMNPTDIADTTLDESIYSNYYFNENIPNPCTKEGIKAFGGLFLPPLYSLVFLFGLLGNSVVVLVLFKYKRLRSMTDVYLLNLAISDLLFVLSLPFWGYYAADQWVFGLGLCKIISWIYLVGFYSGIFFIMLMSIDRYLAIVHAVFSLRARTVTYGVITSLATWSVAVLASLPGLLFSTCYTERNRTYCKTKYSFNSTSWKVLSSLEINVLGLVIPLGIMLFCYSMIIRTLQHCKNEKKNKAMKMIFAVVVLFLGFWTPYNVVLFLETLVELEVLQDCTFERHLDYAIQATETLAFVHCCLNPVIYFFLGEKFRKYIVQLFKTCRGSFVLCQYCRLLQIYSPDTPSSSYTQSTVDHDLHDAL
ncbi:C-C chemokine receptor type 4 [Rhinolophus sinicus]|uniref:C-C chemokine receptor type 4 n=1 Tax=Rhinolophus sinicus TaxID=89399 RepID=UPI0009430D9C|nr:PREDICTED: C-C chemokine receptor type 4 [Rhinolophus sinicus]